MPELFRFEKLWIAIALELPGAVALLTLDLSLSGLFVLAALLHQLIRHDAPGYLVVWGAQHSHSLKSTLLPPHPNPVTP